MSTQTQELQDAVQGSLMLIEVPIDRIIPDPSNRDVGDIQSLATTIKAVGLLHPLVIGPGEDGFFQLSDGHRRLEALKLLERTTALCLLREDFDTPKDVLEASIVANLQRKDPTFLEEGYAFKRLIEEHGYKQSDITARLGYSQPIVSRRLALIDLPPDVIKDLNEERLTFSEGVELSRLNQHPERLRAALESSNSTHRYQKEPITAAVKEQMEALEKSKAMDQRLAQLRAEKVAFIEQPTYVWGEPGPRPLRGSGQVHQWPGASAGQLALNISRQLHAQEPCHAAVMVIEDKGGVEETIDVYLACTEPSRHAPEGESAIKLHEDELEKTGLLADKETGVAAADQPVTPSGPSRTELFKEAKDNRLSFLRAVLEKRTATHAEVLELLIEAWISDTEEFTVDGEEFREIGDLLNVEIPDDDDESWGDDGPEPGVLIRAWSDDPHKQVALAMAVWIFTCGERKLHAMRDADENTLTYYDWLKQQGYEPTDYESDLLNGTVAKPQFTDQEESIPDDEDLRDLPEDSEGWECHWGVGCKEPAAAERYVATDEQWLPVCQAHTEGPATTDPLGLD